MPRLARRVVGHVSREWGSYHVSQSAAAVAFFTLLSLAPVLVFATAAATAFLSRENVQELAKEQLAETIGPGAAEVADAVFRSERFGRGGVAATIGSGVLLLFGASSVFMQLQRTLNRVFGRKRKEGRSVLLGYVLGRLSSTAFAIVGGVFLMAMFVGSVTLEGVANYVAETTGTPAAWWAQFSPLISAGLVAVVLLGLFTFLPAKRPPLRWVLVGVGVATALFELGKWAASSYLANSVIASAYGPSNSLVVFLLWVYYSTHIVLLGAILAQALSEEVGRRDEGPAASE